MSRYKLCIVAGADFVSQYSCHTAGRKARHGQEHARVRPGWGLCCDTIDCIMIGSSLAARLYRDTTNCIVAGGSLAGECVTIQSLYRDRSEGLIGSEGHDTINCIVTREGLAAGECVTIQSVVS